MIVRLGAAPAAKTSAPADCSGALSAASEPEEEEEAGTLLGPLQPVLGPLEAAAARRTRLASTATPGQLRLPVARVPAKWASERERGN